MTELGVGEAVDGGSVGNGEITPNVGARSEVQVVHHTAGRLESLSRIFRSDTAGGSVSLGGWSALDLGAVLVLEGEVDLVC